MYRWICYPRMRAITLHPCTLRPGGPGTLHTPGLWALVIAVHLYRTLQYLDSIYVRICYYISVVCSTAASRVDQQSLEPIPNKRGFKMATVIKPTKDAKFFTNQSNARRALKKIFNCSTEVANSLISMEALEDGGRFWFSEAVVNKAANPQIELDKATLVEVPATPTEPKATKARSEVRNGVRRPIKGKCADVWAALDALQQENPHAIITISSIKDLAKSNGWNINNATIEFYGWRKFNLVIK